MGAAQDESVSLRFVADIIEARVQEIFELIDKELKNVARSGMLPAGCVLTGAGAKLTGMSETAKTCLKLPVCIGTPIGISSVIDRATDVGMSTAVGLVLWGKIIRGSTHKRGVSALFGKLKVFDQLGVGIKKLFRAMKP